MIACYNEKYLDEIIDLWNIVAVKDGYKELSNQSFKNIFTDNPYFNIENTFVLYDDKVTGFACGCVGDDLPLGDVSGYITCIILADDVRTDENYSDLLTSLECSFKKKGKTQSEILFFNPMMLPWYIPSTPKHEHNNAPGVPTDSDFYRYLTKIGYTERTVECAMYLNLTEFKVPEDVEIKENNAAKDGFTVELFDKSKHFGIVEMLNGFDNPLWKTEITECTDKNIPVVIAAHENKVVGFAGPVIRQETGRGYFAGIGVHPDYEGHGLGSILFFKLCEAFKGIKTEYMSLYTGLSNPAIHIYKKAGFIPVREFAVMRKVL